MHTREVTGNERKKRLIFIVFLRLGILIGLDSVGFTMITSCPYHIFYELFCPTCSYHRELQLNRFSKKPKETEWLSVILDDKMVEINSQGEIREP